MTLYRDISIWKLISGLIKNKKDEARPPTTEHQIKNLTNRIISASACLWTLWDPFPLSLPLEPPREHSRVRLICLMTPLCITVLYNRPLPYWFGIFSYGLYFFGHCLLKSGTLPSSFTDVRFYFRFAWFVLEGLIVWLSEAGRGGEGRGGEGRGEGLQISGFVTFGWSLLSACGRSEYLRKFTEQTLFGRN